MKSHEAAPDEDQPKAKNLQITQMDADRGLKFRSDALIKRAKARGKAPVECLAKDGRSNYSRPFLHLRQSA
jgi:hypothetical protein